MPVIHAAEASATTCTAPASPHTRRPRAAARNYVPGGWTSRRACQGTAHVVSREEIVFVLGGTLLVTLGDEPADRPGLPGG